MIRYNVSKTMGVERANEVIFLLIRKPTRSRMFLIVDSLCARKLHSFSPPSISLYLAPYVELDLLYVCRL